MKFFRPTARRGFSLVELLVVIAIVGILATLVILGGGSALEKSRAVKSASDMRQVAAGLLAYAADNDGRFPPLHGGMGWPNPYWTMPVSEYLYGVGFQPYQPGFVAGAAFYSPSVKRHHPIGDLGINSNIVPFDPWIVTTNIFFPISRIQYPSLTALIFEAKGPSATEDAAWYFNVPLATASPAVWLADRHKGWPLVAFCDGSVRSFKYQELLNTWTNLVGPDIYAP